MLSTPHPSLAAALNPAPRIRIADADIVNIAVHLLREAYLAMEDRDVIRYFVNKCIRRFTDSFVGVR